MSEASVLLREFTFTHQGRSWSLGRPTFGVEAKYATYLEGLQFDAIQRHLGRMNEFSYRILLNEWNDNAGALKKFAWGSAAFRQSFDVIANRIQFLWLWFGEHYNQVTIKEKNVGADHCLDVAELWRIYGESDYEQTLADGRIVKGNRLAELIDAALRDPNPLPPPATR